MVCIKMAIIKSCNSWTVWRNFSWGIRIKHPFDEWRFMSFDQRELIIQQELNEYKGTYHIHGNFVSFPDEKYLTWFELKWS